MKIKQLTKRILKMAYQEELKNINQDKEYLLYLHNRIKKL